MKTVYDSNGMKLSSHQVQPTPNPRPKTETELATQVDQSSTHVGATLTPAELVPTGVPTSELKKMFPLRWKMYQAALTIVGLKRIISDDHLSPRSTALAKREQEARTSIAEGLPLLKFANSIAGYCTETSTETRPGLDALRNHQREMHSAIADAIERGATRCWAKLPTGAGKTATFAITVESAVSGLTREERPKTLVLVPRTNLIDQTIDSFTRFCPEMTCSPFYGGEKDLTGDVVVATYQSLERLLDDASREGITFGLVVCDEAHRALTDARQDLLDKLNASFVLGVTATPVFNDLKQVGHLFGECVYDMSLTTAIEAGICSGVRALGIKTNIDMSSLISSRGTGDFQERELDKTLNQEARNRAAIQLMKDPAIADKSTIITCLSVAHGERMATMATEAGVPGVAFVHSGTPKDTLERIYEDFKAGRITKLFAVDLLTEGFDAPRAEVLINLRPTRSPVVAEQRLGRVARLFEGKEYALVIDFVDDYGENAVTPPILARDILGGCAVLPQALREKFERESRESEGGGDIFQGVELPEGFAVSYTIAEEFTAVSSGKGAGITQPVLTREDFLHVLEKSGFSKKELGDTSASSFFSQPMNQDNSVGFRGLGRTLVARYLKDIKNENRYPSAADYKAFGEDLFGDQCFIRKQKSKDPLSAEQVKAIIESQRSVKKVTFLLAGGSSEFLKMKFEGELFTGTGEDLIKRYRLGQGEVGKIEPHDVIRFFAELEMRQEVVRGWVAGVTDKTDYDLARMCFAILQEQNEIIPLRLVRGKVHRVERIDHLSISSDEVRDILQLEQGNVPASAESLASMVKKLVKADQKLRIWENLQGLIYAKLLTDDQEVLRQCLPKCNTESGARIRALTFRGCRNFQFSLPTGALQRDIGKIKLPDKIAGWRLMAALFPKSRDRDAYIALVKAVTGEEPEILPQDNIMRNLSKDVSLGEKGLPLAVDKMTDVARFRVFLGLEPMDDLPEDGPERDRWYHDRQTPHELLCEGLGSTRLLTGSELNAY